MTPQGISVGSPLHVSPFKISPISVLSTYFLSTFMYFTDFIGLQLHPK